MRIAILVWVMVAMLPARLGAQSITNQPVNQTVWLGSNAKFSVGVSGSGAIFYQWQFNKTNLPNNTVTTVAGGGADYPDDGGPATSASLRPSGVTVDASGNLFIADGNNRICKVSIGGILTTVAGNGAVGYSGDNGPATNASLNYPGGLAMDASGNLFIPDTYNNRVRKVDTNGIITTVAGNGLGMFSGDGEAATNASLNYPQGVAVDRAGNLFISDKGNNRIRQVNTSGIIKTVAGSSSMLLFSGDGGAATNATLNQPVGVALDNLGNLFIADANNSRIREVCTNGIITTVAGNGSATFSGDGSAATNASLWWPLGVTVDGLGNLFIADTYNNRIRVVDTNGLITTLFGNNGFGYDGDGSAATNALLWEPWCVAVDAFGDLFVADSHNYRIRKMANTQGPTLALNDVAPANAGKYQVIVTGPGSSVTSSAASLIVATMPLIYAVDHEAGGNLILKCVSKPSSTNELFWSPNVLQPIMWQPVLAVVAGEDGGWQFNDTNRATKASCFYHFLQK